MNILAIGNSFSEDATYYFKKIANSAGVDATVVNLYIGGCSIATHAGNIVHHRASYRYELNGEYTQRTVSIEQVLEERAWDIVTIQQRSGHAGIYATYGDDIKILIACIRKHAADAQIWFHQTWAYELDSCHDDFPIYGKNQERMHQKIKETVSRVCRENGIENVIPAGDVIQEVRKNPLFDYKNGGVSLCRDGFHMDLIYGRYLLGLLWFACLLNGHVEDVAFQPTEKDIVNGYHVEHFDCDTEKIKVLKKIVADYLR